MRLIEFIESYRIPDDGWGYQWNDNHGRLIRCKDCKWFNKVGCSILIYDDSDKPSEDDYCSFAELRGDSDD